MKNSNTTFGTSAYGGDGWSGREQTHAEEIGSIWASCGIDSEWATLRSVLLHRPGAELNSSAEDPGAVQMLEAVDAGLAREQHDQMADTYRQHGVDVHYVEPEAPAQPNLMFCADLVFMTPEGAILARPASTVRAGEERQVARRLAALGIPVLATLRGNAVFEGADAMWADPNTVVISRGLRTNEEAIEQIATILDLGGVNTEFFDLPFGAMHFMGVLRIVDKDLGFYWPRRTPFAAVRALEERGYRMVALPEEASIRQNTAINIVTLGPRKILMVAGFSEFRDFYEQNGVECITVEAIELTKAAGAVGCLSGVLHRDRVGE